MSERRACKATGFCRMTMRYRATRGNDASLRERMAAADRLDESVAATIAEVSQTRDGTLKVKLHDKRAALVDIGRHLGMFNDKLTLKGDAENPLTILVQQLQGSAIKPVDLVPEELPALPGRH